MIEQFILIPNVSYSLLLAVAEYLYLRPLPLKNHPVIRTITALFFQMAFSFLLSVNLYRYSIHIQTLFGVLAHAVLFAITVLLSKLVFQSSGFYGNARRCLYGYLMLTWGYVFGNLIDHLCLTFSAPNNRIIALASAFLSCLVFFFFTRSDAKTESEEMATIRDVMVIILITLVASMIHAGHLGPREGLFVPALAVAVTGFAVLLLNSGAYKRHDLDSKYNII